MANDWFKKSFENWQMRKLLILIVLVGYAASSCKSQAEPIENKMYNCVLSALSKKEKEKVDSIFADFEKHLITKGILESSNAEGYWNMYNQMAETGKYDFSNEFNFFEKIEFLNKESPADNQGIFDCHSKIFESKQYLESKIYEYTKETKSLRGNRVTPVIIAKITIKYLTVEDFELEYYRFMTLMFIADYKEFAKQSRY